MLYWRHEDHGHWSGIVGRLRVARVLERLGYSDAAEEALEAICNDYSMDWRPHAELAAFRIRVLDKTACTRNAHSMETHVLAIALRGLIQACEAVSDQQVGADAQVRWAPIREEHVPC